MIETTTNQNRTFDAKSKGLIWFWLFLLVLQPARLAASPAFTNHISQYISGDWQTEDGLPHNSINAISQTQDGYLWLATKEGLSRFDGARFVTVDATYFSGVKNHSFNTLCATRDSTLWAASEDGILRDVKNGKGFELLLPNAVTNSLLTKIFEGKDGSLWIGTETNGVLRFKDGQFTRLTTNEGLSHNSIRSICEDDQGNLWFATAGGVDCWKNKVIASYNSENGIPHNSTRVVYFDRGGNLWIASHLGLTRFKDGQFTHFRKPDGLRDNLISTIFEDRNGVLWIGTFNGLNRMVDGKLFTETRADGSSYDRVNSICEDQEGNVWIGTRDGLTRLKSRVVTAYTQQQGLTHNNATAVLEDGDTNLWVTFWGGGINKIHNGEVTALTTRDGLYSHLVLSMHHGLSGDFWFGLDYEGGLNLLKGKRFVHYRELEGLTDHAVKAIYETKKGMLWVGTRTALLSLQVGRFQRYTTRDGLPSDTIEVIQEDSRGQLWIGTADGLTLFKDGKFQTFSTKDGLPHNFITTIFEDRDHVLWFGTHGGLGRLENGRFSSFTTKDGLFRDEIFTVVEDDFGFFWMSSRQGIFRVDKNALNHFERGKNEKLICTSFGKSDGMASVECKGTGKTAGWKGADGLLWFPTSKGVVSIDPKGVKVNLLPPPVLIEELQVNGQPTGISNPIQLVAQKQQFVIRYTALSFSAPEKVAFKYKMEGIDNDWIDAGNFHEARYNHLPAGKYLFSVIAANSDGIWNNEGATLSLVLRPPFWQTWWFGCTTGIIVIALFAGVVRYISIQKLQRQLALLEQQHAIEKERSRIAKDMHDDLGANLTQICILSELTRREAEQPERVATHADAISDTAREVVQSMDEIVWAANPKNDTLRKMAGYIFQYAEKFLAPTPIYGRFDHPVSLPEYPVSADVRHNLFLVVKEALNNAVKYSAATELWLRLTLIDSELQIKIEDNGKGFNPEASGGFGNGLLNMKRRMEDIGGRFEIKSASHAGTQITVILKLTAD